MTVAYKTAITGTILSVTAVTLFQSGQNTVDRLFGQHQFFADQMLGTVIWKFLQQIQGQQ